MSDKQEKVIITFKAEVPQLYLDHLTPNQEDRICLLVADIIRLDSAGGFLPRVWRER